MFVIIVFTYLTTTAGYCAAKRRYYLRSPHIFYFYYVYIIFTYVLITFVIVFTYCLPPLPALWNLNNNKPLAYSSFPTTYH